jgi:hypothetical protein
MSCIRFAASYAFQIGRTLSRGGSSLVWESDVSSDVIHEFYVTDQYFPAIVLQDWDFYRE